MRKLGHVTRLLWLLSGLAIILLTLNAAAADDLAGGFQRPPESARPWVYWFWLNGNITREGITADLEAMKRVGIGGVLIMEVDQGAPLGPVPFMSDQWRALFKHVTAEAQRLGLEVNMNNDAGWNGSGGPWIKPEQSMQKVVFSETTAEGPKPCDQTLPQPETVAGYYRDIAVLAFPETGTYRIDNIAVKACYQSGGAGPATEKDLPPEMRIAPGEIVNLTTQMKPDGRLEWEVPAGKWTILRFGHTSTGVENAPSPASGRGLECDKLGKEGIEANFAGMMGKLIDDSRPLAGKALIATHIDSWENGAQNWTARMREEFQARRGYDPLPFLPVMTGRAVESQEISERFLWDLRQTISDLVVENYAGRLRELAHENNMRLSIEAYGGPCDDAPYAGRADEPMGEFWIGGGALGTCKEMASAAHTYGKPIVGAESFTAGDQERWLDHPGTIKALGDRAFCAGINRFVFHRYALQPWIDRRPGMTMGPWGTHYERTQTWWELTPAWHDYLARCQFLLRQGRFVADVCFLQPETAPQGFTEHKLSGYDYDNCSAEAVLTRMSVQEGWLYLPDGMRYRLLVLPDRREMTPQLLRKLAELVQAGATILGPRPEKAPSLAGYPECDEEVKRIAAELWGDCDGQQVKEHRYGQGRVVSGLSPEECLAQTKIGPDFNNRARLNYIHRAVGDTDLYFVANPHAYALAATCVFRDGAGRRPELWHPDSGHMEPAPAFTQTAGGVSLPLTFEPSGSMFVVFRQNIGEADPVTRLACGGETLFSADALGPKIVVSEANYGVLDDPQRSRDVRAAVQRLAENGELSFQVRRLAEEEDPAPGVLKTLAVKYEIEGKTYSATGNDNDFVHLTGDTPGIVIEKAAYGVLDDPQRTRDVRDKLQHLVDTGETTFEVARMAQGDDPAFMVVKTLVVDYTVAGEHKTIRGIDPETLSLALPPPPSEQTAELRMGADGKPRLEVHQPGRYEVTMASGKSTVIDAEAPPEKIDLDGPWTLRFPPDSGAPEQVTMDKLISWSKHGDPGVKYFSGTAAYAQTFRAPENIFSGDRRMYLDLGAVYAFAEVTLNGHAFPVLWKPPFRLDVTEFLTPGKNSLEVRVTNLWVNRLIGDEQLPEDSARNPEGTLKSWPQWILDGQKSPTGRCTFTTWRLWKKDAALQSSGLLGPVKLETTLLLSFK